MSRQEGPKARSPAQAKSRRAQRKRADSTGPGDMAPGPTANVMTPGAPAARGPRVRKEEALPRAVDVKDFLRGTKWLSGKTRRLRMPISRDRKVCGLEPRSPPDARVRPHQDQGPGQLVPSRPSGQTARGRRKMPLSGEEERALPEPGRRASTSNAPSPLARPPEPPSRAATRTCSVLGSGLAAKKRRGFHRDILGGSPEAPKSSSRRPTGRCLTRLPAAGGLLGES